MKKILLLLIFVLSFTFTIADTGAQTIAACTQEAKLCPDGKTWVGRTLPNCEFQKCPDEDVICPITVPPKCEFGYKVVREGLAQNGCRFPVYECKKDPGLCPEAIPPICKGGNGYEIDGYIYHGDDCKIPKYKCKELIMCTEEYDPVCGQKPRNCTGDVCTQVYPISKTYENTCEMKRDGAKLLYKGECKKDTGECTTEYAPVCADTGVRCITWPCNNKKTFGNKCQAEKAGARFLYEGKCEDTIKCTKEFAPVCGKIKTPACNAPDCVGPYDTGYQLRTFSNKCHLKAAGATYMYQGSCKNECPIYDLLPPRPGCRYEYVTNGRGCKVPKLVCDKPTCPTPIVAKPAPGCKYIYEENENGCKIPKLFCDDLPIKIKNLADRVLAKYEAKLKAMDIEAVEKVEMIESLVVKLEKLYNNSKSTTAKKLIKYLIEKLGEMAERFEEDNVDDIFDLFN